MLEKTIQALAQRDRWVVGFALAGIAAVTWIYLAHEVERFAATGVCQCAAAMIGGADLAPWSPLTLAPLFLMWTEMMVAMMLPAVTPLVLLFSKVARSRHERGHPYVSTAFFVAGLCGLDALQSHRGVGSMGLARLRVVIASDDSQ